MDKRDAKKNIRRRVFSSDPSKLVDEVVNLCDAVEVLAYDKNNPPPSISLKDGQIVLYEYPIPEPGEPGPPGPKPVAGIDYPIPEDGNDGYTPIKGVDYFDGKDADEEKIVKEVLARIPPVKNGKDADEGRVVKAVLAQIPSPKEILPDNPVQIRQKLESLRGKQRLNVNAIDGLDKHDKNLTESLNKSWNEILRHIPIGGVSDFKQLHDVPQSYVGQTGKVVKVNTTETGLEFGTASSSFTPVRGESHTISVDGANVITAVHTPLYGVSAWVNGNRVTTSVAGDQVTVLTDVYTDDLVLFDYEY